MPENHGSQRLCLDRITGHRYANTWLLPLSYLEMKTMQGVKGLIFLSVVATAFALGACRREAPAPLKLGAEMPVTTHIAR